MTSLWEGQVDVQCEYSLRSINAPQPIRSIFMWQARPLYASWSEVFLSFSNSVVLVERYFFADAVRKRKTVNFEKCLQLRFYRDSSTNIWTNFRRMHCRQPTSLMAHQLPRSAPCW